MTESAKGARGCMNDSGTCTPVDTKLTQRRSAFDPRAALIIKREKIGASTPTGHVISNAVEQIGNLETYERPSWAKDERQTLPFMLKKSLARLAR